MAARMMVFCVPARLHARCERGIMAAVAHSLRLRCPLIAAEVEPKYFCVLAHYFRSFLDSEQRCASRLLGRP